MNGQGREQRFPTFHSLPHLKWHVAGYVVRITVDRTLILMVGSYGKGKEIKGTRSLFRMMILKELSDKIEGKFDKTGKLKEWEETVCLILDALRVNEEKKKLMR